MSTTDNKGTRTRPVRSLVTELLAAQLVVTGAIGLYAFASLAWIANSFVNDSVQQWAAQWTTELDELGAPFYLSDNNEALLGVERFIAKYPEIESVTWFAQDGMPMMSVDDAGLRNVRVEPLAIESVAELSAMVGSDRPFLLAEIEGPGQRFRFSGPVWTESVTGDGLLLENPAEIETATELYGFVAVDLDYAPYQAALIPQLATASLALIVLLAISWIAGRIVLKRALLPLSELQRPLVELAGGRRDLVLPRSPHAEIQNIVTALDNTIDALDKREKHLLHLATHDSLTGLYGRDRFMEALRNEIVWCGEKNHSSALLFIDLDQFKYVNDTIGHIAGDEMLKAAGRQIRQAVRSEDVVARFGGDEFVALIRDVGRSEARHIATKVLQVMRSVSHASDDQVFQMQCSIGVAEIGSDRFGPQELLVHADIACRTAKALGRNRVELYNISSRQTEQAELDVKWMRKIRHALESEGFELHYQPLLHIPSRSVSHYEALLRMKGEDALVLPDRFLPSAVRFGLMTDIDLWVIARAIHALAESRAAFPTLRLSVNFTAYAFEVEDIASRVQSLLQEHGVSGEHLVFEITEQLAVRFAASTDRQFVALRDLGCQFAIDDFGTGYSSFSYLKRLPVDYLKIDGSFIRELANDPVDQATVRMMAEVASAAGIETVAEYVQTQAVFELLVDYGIDYAQGSYVGDARATVGTPPARRVEPDDDIEDWSAILRRIEAP